MKKEKKAPGAMFCGEGVRHHPKGQAAAEDTHYDRSTADADDDDDDGCRLSAQHATHLSTLHRVHWGVAAKILTGQWGGDGNGSTTRLPLNITSHQPSHA